ncbi:3'(2'),5'-bisphosphate nucleotidase CysQ [Oceanisphaera marina]|uniref:3'(2'),5'-bisphosphate nucleotidase CysQ n=1 Tax=Oceanisphaera marina TaxID=2017550 RepID=A0ABQ1IGR1_9GAMM|nr:3'(2'),5'-bisphosphate nucleotidase CysQ [Oceanisphaera marina]GGB39851.1 3'(2'),5'-bisphosphate nucleotidase CysQ [Oceanisphaera marina]
MDISALLPGVIAAARESGGLILSLYNSGQYQAEHKDDNSPVTSADFAAHDYLKLALRAIADIPVLSEEGCEVSLAERSSWPRYWLVDPLDGTQEFIAGSGDFSTMIALIEYGKPVLGVVYGPVNDLLYYAVSGQGAFKQVNGETRAISASHYDPDKPLTQLRITISRRQNVDWVRARLTTDLDYQLVPLGSSSLKSCLVAEGGADIYMRIGPTGEWDTGATQCIVEEAGGRILDLYLEPLSYNRRDTLINPNFMTMGDPGLPWPKILINPAGAGDQH